MSQPKSIRLTQAHRNDMVKAVMNEWVKQNPKPALGSELRAVAVVVATAMKNSPSAKRTAKFLEHFGADEEQHVKKESRVNYRVFNKQGEERHTKQIYIPLSVAKEVGLASLRSSGAVSGLGYRMEDLGPEDFESLHSYEDAKRLAEGRDGSLPFPIKVATFVESGYPYIDVQDDHPALVAAKEKAKVLREWDAEYNRNKEELADILAQFTSTKQLREQFPSIVPYLPPHIADPEGVVRLPVLAISRLEERLGIKPKEQD